MILVCYRELFLLKKEFNMAATLLKIKRLIELDENSKLSRCYNLLTTTHTWKDTI